MDEEGEVMCPVCKSDRYLNPKMHFLLSPCYHKVCDGCISRLFSSGTAPCPVCHTTLRRTHWTRPVFEDVTVERECRVRRRLAGIFCRGQEDFEQLRDYNDYLEEVEEIVFNLVNEVDVQEMEAKLDAYRLANQEQIKRGLGRLSAEEERTKQELALEAARKEAAHQEALLDLQMDVQTRLQQESQFIQALESSNESATEIEARLAKQRAQQLRTASATAASRLVSIEDRLPSLRGLKKNSSKEKVEIPIDPLETVPLLALPPAISPPSMWDEHSSGLLYELPADVERTAAAGYTRSWLLKSCWESAFSYGLVTCKLL